MIRSMVSSALRTTALVKNLGVTSLRLKSGMQCANYSSFNNATNNFLKQYNFHHYALPVGNSLQSGNVNSQALIQQQPVRSVTKFSLNKGKRKTVKAVLKRFKRLDWGAWIRTHCGRHKKMFKKSAALKRRLRQHVFTNATQSWLLDKMVTSYWRRPKYYIDDPYAPYHKRDEFFATKSKTFKV